MEYSYSYRFTEKAENDLDEILRYISDDLNNPSAANDLVVEFFNSVNNILAFPKSGKTVINEFLSDRDIRRVLVSNYTLYYKISDEEKVIYLVRFIYSKRNTDESVMI